MENKKCSKCNEILNVSNFYRDKNKSCGYGSQCKKCKDAVTKLRRENNKKSNIYK